MAEKTKIQWTDNTFNCWRGCTKVAAGCANCYAEKQSKRNPKTLGIWGDEGTRVVAAEAQWRAVEKWNREAARCVDCGKDKKTCGHWPASWRYHARPRVFVGSLMDWAENWDGPMSDSHGDRMAIDPDGKWLPVTSPQYGDRWLTMADVRARLFRLIDDCPNLDFLLLTKRPENILDCWNAADHRPAGAIQRHRGNVWLVTSIATQADADKNIPELLKGRDLVPVLGVSAEPLVGPVDLSRWTIKKLLDWIICGGESGPNARPFNVDWARSIIRQCREAGVACFIKQIGQDVDVPHTFGKRREWPSSVRWWEYADGCGSTGCPGGVMLNDSKGGDPSEWPEDLRVREFPS